MPKTIKTQLFKILIVQNFQIASKMMRIGLMRRLMSLQNQAIPPKWTQLVKKMEDETNLAQNAALKVLYQKAQASLMFRYMLLVFLIFLEFLYFQDLPRNQNQSFSIMKKLPSSETHPLNTLRHKYFDSDVKNEIGLKMFLIIIVTNALGQETRRPGDQLKRLKLAQLVELLYLAFEIQVLSATKKNLKFFIFYSF